MNEIMLNEEHINDVSSLSDQEIVEKLRAGDNGAWGYIYLHSVLPVLKKERFYRILLDRKLSRLDVYGMIVEIMCAKKKLNLFEFRCPLIYWIRFYVSKVVLEYCEKNDNPVSSEDYENVLIGKEAPAELPKDELEFAQRCFATLWRKNPMRAYVHLLKTKNDLSLRQIQLLLNISSEKNAGKIAERALSDMRELRESLPVTGGVR